MSMLANRRNILAAVLTAFGGPYFLNETETGQQWWTLARQYVQSSNSSLGMSGGQPALLAIDQSPTVHPLYQTEKLWNPVPAPLGVTDARYTPSMVGGPVHDLRDVVRFDVSPNWVFQHFSRVTTVLADLHLDGLRVPLVTGTEADDLAGTLTYYFDRQHRVQRINLHGFTGDATRLTGMMQQNYAMKAQPSLGAGTYVVQWNGKTTSILQLTHAPVVHSDALNAKVTVFLELNQPSMPYGMSVAAESLVAADRQTFRW